MLMRRFKEGYKVNPVFIGRKGCIFLQGPALISWFLRLLSIDEFSQTFLAAKIITSPFEPFSNGGSHRDIGLAIGILNKFLQSRLFVQFFPRSDSGLDQVAKNREK